MPTTLELPNDQTSFHQTFAALAAKNTPIKFQLDWRFEGPAALFVTPAAKGYFKDAKLDVTIDAGNGSGGTVTRVASGTYDMGFADLAALMEFHANKPVAVMMVYNNTPASVMALKKSGIKTVADLNGKKLGAPVFDAGRRAFPIFAKANNINGVQWTAMKMLLLDEPFGALDAFTREELWCILGDLWTEQRFNVILVTHDLRESVFLADTVYVMSKSPGRFVVKREIDLPRPRELEVTYTQAFGDIVHELRSHIGAIRSPVTAPTPATEDQ